MSWGTAGQAVAPVMQQAPRTLPASPMMLADAYASSRRSAASNEQCQQLDLPASSSEATVGPRLVAPGAPSGCHLDPSLLELPGNSEATIRLLKARNRALEEQLQAAASVAAGGATWERHALGRTHLCCLPSAGGPLMGHWRRAAWVGA